MSAPDDPIGWGALDEAALQRVRAFARRAVRRLNGAYPVDAEDLIQSALMKLSQRPASAVNNVAGYCCTTIEREITDLHRVHKNRPSAWRGDSAVSAEGEVSVEARAQAREALSAWQEAHIEEAAQRASQQQRVARTSALRALLNALRWEQSAREQTDFWAVLLLALRQRLLRRLLLQGTWGPTGRREEPQPVASLCNLVVQIVSWQDDERALKIQPPWPTIEGAWTRLGALSDHHRRADDAALIEALAIDGVTLTKNTWQQWIKRAQSKIPTDDPAYQSILNIINPSKEAR